MNLLLLEPEELAKDGTARLTDRRLLHARDVLRAQATDQLRVGVRNGNTGLAEILSIDETALHLRAELSAPPPARPGIDLLLAMPRPKALRRILPALASFGVDHIAIVNAATVEKSYFATPHLAPEAVRDLFSLGLEQSRDTRAPTLSVHPLFRPFVEDDLDNLFPQPARRLVAHPSNSHSHVHSHSHSASTSASASAPASRTLLAIGPEGGWVPFELSLLATKRFTQISLGQRPLRTEVAIPALLGALLAAD